MPHIIKSVVPQTQFELLIRFRNGTTKQYDMKPLMESIDHYRHFLSDMDQFSLVQVSPDGESVFWNEYTDCGCEELWRNGKTVKTSFDSLLSCSDAAELWHVDQSTLRKAIASGRLREGTDMVKFGKQWVITVKAMQKTFGSPGHWLDSK